MKFLDCGHQMLSVEDVVTVTFNRNGEGLARTRDGDTCRVFHSRESLEFALNGHIVPDHGSGCQCLMYWSDDEGDWHYLKPIIAWRIDSGVAAEPITPADNDHLPEYCSGGVTYAVVFPDGSVEIPYDSRHETLEAALVYLKKQAEDARERKRRKATAGVSEACESSTKLMVSQT
jgi:hypothetical protein